MKKILIIDDNESVRDNIAEILELANYYVLKAEMGKQALSWSLKARPDHLRYNDA